jgi:hypothetical protein
VAPTRWRWRRGAAFDRTSGGGGLSSKSPKPSRWGSVLGAPMEKVAGVDEGRYLGGTYEVVAMVGRHVRQRGAGEGVGAENPKPRMLWAHWDLHSGNLKGWELE